MLSRLISQENWQGATIGSIYLFNGRKYFHKTMLIISMQAEDVDSADVLSTIIYGKGTFGKEIFDNEFALLKSFSVINFGQFSQARKEFLKSAWLP